MWACLQDQDTTGQWKQVAGWRKVCDLALAHLSRLREYRRGLAEAWPPETNAAARAYLGELDQLIDQVQRTHDAAAANYDALAAATRAIGSTRAELQPLYDEYAEKVRQKRAYETILADPKAVAGSRLPEKPPVTDADLEQLNVRARGLMTGLSGELQQAQVMLRQPPPRKWPGRDDGAAGPNEQSMAPVIPPIVAVPLPTASRSTRPGRQATAGTPLSSPSAPGVGPILGGAGAGLAPPPVSSSVSPGTPHAQPMPQQNFGTPPSITSFPNSSGRLLPPSRLGEPRGPLGRPSVGDAKSLPHATPPRTPPLGGLIGGAPGMGVSQPSSSVPPRRVNPVGGVIGGGGAGTAPSGAAGSRPGAGRAGGTHNLSPIGGAPGLGPTGAGGSPNRSIRGSQSERDQRIWDPDHPWEIDEGTPPIVRPPEDKGPIDPGPAIGFDR